MDFSITAMGILTMFSAAFGFLNGGHLIGGGFRFSASFSFTSEDIKIQQINITPNFFIQMPVDSKIMNGLNIDGSTLGGTILLKKYGRLDCTPQPKYSDLYIKYCINYNKYRDEYEKNALDYELGHLPAWEHFGIFYPIYAIFDSCRYDPGWDWGGSFCNYEQRSLRQTDTSLLMPTTGAFVIKFP